ncbi:hypothetical protein CC80DRAFT_534433 [Byssothecium circinans]|uniref:Peptidase S8/S53 domain-containing protein n=1 Tax=Byssothecium circinans TaxID=147558 RepID=A0A6A5U013_9PLEO|nr:hypothetical protein CC80DRAFT_534433 [Byssothecium circinans]
MANLDLKDTTRLSANGSSRIPSPAIFGLTAFENSIEKHIEFDLAGVPHPSITQSYLDRLANHVQFESILKYVALPKLSIEPEKPSMQRKNNSTNMKRASRGLNDMVRIFNWLRTKHVRKIVKVIVIDDDQPAHSAAAIKEALQGFDVEVWDWKKLDICSSVICDSSKCIREISLYSTGNNAVLMGWASAEGFTNTKHFPMLERLKLYIREGLEDEGTRSQYTNAFKERLNVHRQIEVGIFPDNNDVSYASEFQSPESGIQADDPWMKAMLEFAVFLRSIPEARRSPIKVAIIDDGLDASQDSFDTRLIAGGKSFCPHPNSTDLMNAYFVPSGKHGTRMATLISLICPHVRLFIARLDLSTINSTQFDHQN